MSAAAGLLVAGFLVPTFGGAGVLAKSTAEQATPLALSEPPLPQISTILASDGATIAQFYYENRTDVTIDKISPIMQKALIDIEDARFYQHGPLDLQGTLRALVRNQATGSTAQGGSSLTQQYVKNVLFETAGTRVADAQDQLRIATSALARAKSKADKASAQASVDKAKAALDVAKKDQLITIAPKLSRKIQELRHALWVEQHYSKQDILTKYLNVAFFAHRTYGVQAAAQRYFSVDASQLDVGQAAMLAGMVNNANLYDPILHPQATLTRRNAVLNRMASLGTISKAEAARYKSQDLGLHEKIWGGGCDGIKYGNFCSYVQDEILNNPTFGATGLARQQLLNTGGLVITTTLDRKAQDAAQKAVDKQSSPTDRMVTAEAMVQPGTGKIVAIAQSRPYGIGKKQTTIDFAADNAHGGQAGTQAGSTFKIFTLAAALANGFQVGQSYPTPYQTTVDGFTDCKGNRLSPWDVHNSETTNATSMDLESATWGSINTYFAQLEKDVGLCNVMNVARDFGMTAPDGRQLLAVPTFTLGADEIDIVHEAAAYAGFAASGRYCSPIAITAITQNGRPLAVPDAKCHQAIKADVANEVTKVLKGVLTKGTASSSYSGLSGNRDAAGKTGTTDGQTTVLFAGYTPNMAAVVWEGNPAKPFGDPVGLYGANLVPVWEASMNGALAGQPNPSFPDPTGNYGTGGNTTTNASPSPGPGKGKGNHPGGGKPTGRPTNPGHFGPPPLPTNPGGGGG